MFDGGQTRGDRTILRQRYAFLEFVECADGADLREHIRGRYGRYDLTDALSGDVRHQATGSGGQP